MTKTFKLASETETKKIGQIMTASFTGGEIIELIGPIGAGKTTLAKAIIAGFGASGAASPTFILDSVYPVRLGTKRVDLHHLDLYRLKSAEELLTLGIYDSIGDPETITIIEWADRFPITDNHGKMTIEFIVSRQNRRLKITSTDNKHDRILENIAAALIKPGSGRANPGS